MVTYGTESQRKIAFLSKPKESVLEALHGLLDGTGAIAARKLVTSRAVEALVDTYEGSVNPKLLAKTEDEEDEEDEEKIMK